MNIITMKKLISILDVSIESVRESVKDNAKNSYKDHGGAESELSDEQYAEEVLKNLDKRLNGEYKEPEGNSHAIPPELDKKLYLLTNYHHFLGEMKGIVLGYSKSKEIVARITNKFFNERSRK